MQVVFLTPGAPASRPGDPSSLRYAVTGAEAMHVVMFGFLLVGKNVFATLIP